ncbi:hypothetical protein EGR_04112 [Echinococcus granulosus]|uniref:Uncharacterized protein n=1 Tax=Echinococcus granulosus TaxID=6210 RepID=W6V4J9_ECHGR|nr:hypothetical protein EGR_04112 [Echinococcus granulosus]EUB61079.1 hypothetical protein EGR_04112 [Echinococcus granulosus]
MPKLLNLTKAFAVVVSSLFRFIPKILTVMPMVVIIHKFWEYDLPNGPNFWDRNTEFLAIESANQQVHYDGKGLVFCRFPTYPSRRQQKGSSSKEFCHTWFKIWFAVYVKTLLLIPYCFLYFRVYHILCSNWFGFMSVFSHIGPNGHKLEMPTMVNTNHLLLPKTLCKFVELSEIKRQGHKYYGLSHHNDKTEALSTYLQHIGAPSTVSNVKHASVSTGILYHCFVPKYPEQLFRLMLLKISSANKY